LSFGRRHVSTTQTSIQPGIQHAEVQEQMKMKRIVLGMDSEGHYEPAAHLLARLRPEGAAVDVFHCAEIPFLVSDMTLPSSVGLMTDILEEEKKLGQRLAEDAARRLRETGLTVRASDVTGGYPSAAIMHYADENKADLIAVAGTHKGALRAFFLGSVARALVTGAHQNVLVAKGDIAPEGTVRAVFATDHSEYANRCLQELLALAPRGLSHLTVITCYPKELVRAMRPFLDEFALDPAEWIEKNLEERNEKVRQMLEPLGCPVDTRIFADAATSSIPVAMKDTGADLLILGAQGHGFLERLTLGSTSFHQVMAEPYSVLVLRAPSPGKKTGDSAGQ
jgi:nucleotide-binding universal stress UspA family protein